MSSRLSRLLFAPFERALGGLSLRRKLMMTLVCAGSGIMAVTALLIVLLEWTFTRQQLAEEYWSTARLLGDRVELQIILGTDIDETRLEVFSEMEEVKVWGILDTQGHLKARYPKVGDIGPLDLSAAGWVRFHYLTGRIEVLAPIEINTSRFVVLEGETVVPHYVYLVGDIGDTLHSILLKIGAFILTMVVIGAFVIWVTSRLSRMITKPILSLAGTARRISEDQNFSQRQVKIYDDETGQLVDAFNEMMEKLEQRDDIIRRNEARFRGYFELGVVGMAILDGEGCFREANERLGTMLGVELGSLRKTHFDRWLWHEEGEAGVCFQDLARDSETGHSEELWLETRSGDRRYVIVSLCQIAGADVEERLYLTVVQDITDRKRSETELEKSKRAAEEANRSKDEFLSVMSHELRTPLNPIIGFVDLLMHSDDDPERLGMLQSIRRSSDHLLTLIGDVLEFSRAQAGRLEAMPAPFVLKDVCRNAVVMMSRNGEENEVEVILRSLDQSRLGAGQHLVGDAGKIRQVLLNLLSNAVKYNRAGGKVWLDAEVSAARKGEALLELRVEDTGIGIAAEKLDRVFEPFTQLDMSLQRKHEGVGLGLAICKRIAECLGGTIDLRSEVGKGSVFVFRVPVAVSEVVAISPEEKSQRWVPGPIGDGRILVVEDDAENKRLVEAKLKQMKVSYDWAGNGIDALERTAETQYSLVLMDIRMPLMDGLEATRIIRQRESGSSHLPIVAMTAHVSDRMRAQCTDAGMDGCLTKPVRIPQLEETLRQYLPVMGEKTD